MAANNVFRVAYHWEKSGLRASETLVVYAIASSATQANVFTVLNNNSKVPTGLNQSNLVIENATHTGDSGAGSAVLS